MKNTQPQIHPNTMQQNTRKFGVLFRALIVVAIAATGVSCTTPVGALRGYTLFSMPSKNYQIGSVINRSDQSVILEQNINENDPLIRRNAGPSKVAETIKNNYEASVNAKLRSSLAADGKTTGADSIEIELENVELWSIPQAGFVNNLTETIGGWDDSKKQYYIDGTKRRVFGLLPPRVSTVTISDLLIADCRVKKNRQRTGSASAEFEPGESEILRKELNIDGSGKFKTNKDGSFEGTQLCFGFRGDPHMFGSIVKTFNK